MLIKYHLIYYGISCLLIVISLIVSPIFYLFLGVYLLFIIYRLNLVNLIAIIVFTLIFTILLNWPKPCNDKIIEGKIITASNDSIVLKTAQTKVKVYGEFTGYKIGDKLKIEVEYFELAKPTNDNAFNYANYLYSQGITNNASIKRLLSYSNHETWLQKLQSKMNSQSEVDGYAKMFILGIKDDIDDEDYQRLTDLSIVHLFALSGLHINMLMNMLKKILCFIMPEAIVNYVVIGIIGLYVYLIPFNVSFVRAYLVTLLNSLFKGYLNKLDSLAIVTILMLIINPYIIYSLSFIFSYFIYFIILLLNKNKYFNLIVFFGSLPIILMIQYRINVLSIVLTVILVPLIKILYFSLWLYVLFGSIFKEMVSIVIYFLNNIIVFCDDFSFYINFSKPTLFFMLAYYFIYFQIILQLNIKRKATRSILMLVSLIIMFYMRPYYNMVGRVVMIDVGQGDCFLIQQPFNQGNILIDTGGLMNRDLASDTLIPYLHSLGIFELDYVFISHDDFDHCGSYDSLAKQIKIKNTVTTYHQNIDIGRIKIEMLNALINSDDKNDQSLVIKATINNLDYLFMGDASVKVEKALLEQYPDLKADVLKVSHHGSNTGTSAQFLDAINAKIALISCGKNNRYNHPHDEIITRLKDYGLKIYRSDTMGMVKVVYYGKDNYIYP